MWTAKPLARALRLRVAFVALSLALPSLAAAAPGPQSSDPGTAAERRGLRQAVEQSFEVLPVSGGVLLKPRVSRDGVKSVELKGDEVAINGERVNLKTAQDWLGDRAEPVLRLQRLKAQDRLALLGVAPVAGSAESEAAPPAPAADEGETLPAEPAEEETAGAPAPPAPPEPPAEPAEPDFPSRKNTGERVNVGGGVTVEKGEKAEQVVAIGGPARVEGEVDHDVVSVGGSVHVDGKVGGEVVSVGASVYLGPHAEVDGDVTSVGGSIQREPGAVIHGSTHEVGLFSFLRHGNRWDRDRDWDTDFGPWSFFGRMGELVGRTMWFAFVCFFCCLVVLVAREPLERVMRQLRMQPWQSVGVGFVGSLAVLPATLAVMILLAITLVGCLLFPFLWLFLILIGLLGYTAVALRLGEAVEARFNLRGGNPYVAVLIGVFLLHLGTILAGLLGWVGGPIRIFAVFFALFGFLARISAMIVGFGAVILARFGTAPGYWPRAGAPGAPGVPVVPPPPAGGSYGVPVVQEAELPLSHTGGEGESAEDGGTPMPPPAG